MHWVSSLCPCRLALPLAPWLPSRGWPLGSPGKRWKEGGQRGLDICFLGFPSLWSHCGLAATLNQSSQLPLAGSLSLSVSPFLSSFAFSGQGEETCFPAGPMYCTLFLGLSFTPLTLCKLSLQTGVCHLLPARLGTAC